MTLSIISILFFFFKLIKKKNVMLHCLEKVLIPLEPFQSIFKTKTKIIKFVFNMLKSQMKIGRYLNTDMEIS